MEIWLVKAGEPIPTDPGIPRLMRTGYLAKHLVGRGVSVTWWTAAFDHQRKLFRTETNETLSIEPNFSIRLVQSPGYIRNISLRRWYDDISMAVSLYRQMRAVERRPDMIVCSYPLMFVSYAICCFARRHGIPFILDVRDMWPDIFALSDSRPKSFLAKLFSWLHRPMVRRMFSKANGIVGITDSFLQWGLTYAGRLRAQTDIVFPLTSEPAVVLPSRQAEVAKFWHSHGVTKETFNFCYFGVFSNKVDLLTVVDAARRLSPDSNIRVVLCGAGDDYEEVAMAAQGVSAIVTPGWIDAEKIRVLMDMAVGGLAPYRNRVDFLSSIPNKVIEYISLGLPVICGIGGELRKLLEEHECGIAYEEGKSEQLASIMQSLAADANRHNKLSENAKALYEKMFEARQVYENFADYVLRMAAAELPEEGKA